MENKKVFVTCILCPRGCELSVEINNGEYIINGNNCNKGKDYAITELTNPTRTITTTVKTVFKEYPRLSVRTDGEIPLKDIFKYMNEINKVVVKDKLKVGDIILKNILNSRVNLVSTGDMTV